MIWRCLGIGMLAISVLCCRASAATPTTAPAVQYTIANPLCEKMQEILGIHDTGADILRPLSSALLDLSEDSEPQPNDAINTLVLALNKGAKPNALSQLYVPQIAISNSPYAFEVNRKWRYGKWPDRVRLIGLIWSRAKLVEDDDPDQAARYAKAALLLCAHEEFASCGSGLHMLKLEELALLKIAHLPDAQQQELGQFFDDRAKRLDGLRGVVRPASEALDQVINLPQGEKIPTDLLKQIVAALGNMRDFSDDDHLPDQLQVVMYAWELRNYGVNRSDPDTIAAADKFLSDWEAKVSDKSILKKWLDEAQHTLGAARMNPRIVKQNPQ